MILATGSDGRGDRVSTPTRPILSRLKKRADFLRAAKGPKVHLPVFTLQAIGPGTSEAATSGCRVGFTVTKKVGKAFERNRIRRRLKEALRLVPALAARAGHDYVLVARRDVLAAPFPALVADLDRSFRTIHDRAGGGGRRHGQSRPPGLKGGKD